jgi:phosphatidylinositol alpha-1,6-mannosyltransferase
MGGMQRVSMQLVDAFSHRKDVHVDTIILHANWKGIGFQTTLFLLKQWATLPSKVREFNSDIILFSSMVTAALAPRLRSRIKVPMVAINHGRDVTLPVAPYQWYIRSVFRNLDASISVSAATRNECLHRGMNPSDAHVLPNGLPETTPILGDRSEAIRFVQTKYDLLTDADIIISVGRQVRRKGHVWFIEKVLPLIDKPINVILVGDGPERVAIQDAISKNNGRHRIVMTGKIDDETLDTVYRSADVFVMPNIPVPGDMEGFGIVMLEANMRGVPIVASNLEGIADVVEEGKNGHLVDPQNENQFAQRLSSLLQHKEKLNRNEIAEYVITQFSWKSIASQYLELFEKIQKQHHAH